MTKEWIFTELAHYKDILEEKGYQVLYIGLYGSQNYNLDDEESDIDVKAIIMPNLHNIVFREVVSKTIECERGNIDVKDLLTFYNVIKKGNFSYIESIATQYYIGDDYLKSLFSQIAVNKKSMLGAMYEKRKALTHEYPSKHGEFERWGFDPKQHHHILRLYDVLKHNYECQDSKSFLTYEENDPRRVELLNTKRNKGNVAKTIVETESDNIIVDAKKFIENGYKYEEVDLSETVYEYIENGIRKEIQKKEKNEQMFD